MTAESLTSSPIRGRQAVRLIATLCATLFVGTMRVGAPLVLLPYIATTLGTDVALLGQVTSAAIVVTFVVAVLIGPLVRRYGFRRLYVAGTLAMALSAALVAAAPYVLTFFLAALLNAFANAIALPVAVAIAATQLAERTSHRAISYLIACLFAAVAVGLPAIVLLASRFGWRSVFVILTILPLAPLGGVLTAIPIGARTTTDGEGLREIIRSYAALFKNRSLQAVYVFWTLYVLCAFGSAAYASALVLSRGFTAENLSLVLAVIGIAFIVSSLASGELVGRFKPDLRIVIAVFAILFCAARGWVYLWPLPLGAILGLFAVASVSDAVIGVALRAHVAAHDVPDRTLSMVFFGACDSLGQALGGVLLGAALAFGGYAAIGGVVYVVCVVAMLLFVLSQWRLPAQV